MEYIPDFIKTTHRVDFKFYSVKSIIFAVRQNFMAIRLRLWKLALCCIGYAASKILLVPHRVLGIAKFHCVYLYCVLFSLVSFVKTNSTPQREAQRRSCLKGSQRLYNIIYTRDHMIKFFFRNMKILLFPEKSLQLTKALIWLPDWAESQSEFWLFGFIISVIIFLFFYIWILILSLVKKIFFLRENFEAREDATGGDMLL